MKPLPFIVFKIPFDVFSFIILVNTNTFNMASIICKNLLVLVVIKLMVFDTSSSFNSSSSFDSSSFKASPFSSV